MTRPPKVEQVDAHARADAGAQQRRQQQGIAALAALEAVAGDAHRRQHAHHHADGGGHQRHLQAEQESVGERRVLPRFHVPGQRVAGRGEIEDGGLEEAQPDHQHDGAEHERIHEDDENAVQPRCPRDHANGLDPGSRDGRAQRRRAMQILVPCQRGAGSV
ncbi:hypothetical protein G6F68_013743 [Rhizopus microsporus]|nr:hypothetical protein G6F68_013743 [Rhizopus microsporus]